MPEKDVKQIFIKNLKYYLKKKGITQAELAKHLKVSKSTISNWMSGLTQPRMNKVDAICELLEINRSDLMEEKKDKDNYNDARELVEFIYNDPNMLLLFEEVKNTSPERLKVYYELLKNLKKLDSDN